MALSVRELHPGFAAEVMGLDLARTVPDATVAELQDAIDRHGVLVFRGQHLDDDSQIAFAQLFGPPERYVLSYRPGIKLRLGRAEMVDVSNLDAVTGAPQDREARHRMVNLGNRLWHTDSSFKQVRGAYSMLYAHAVPPAGGETEFGDGRKAYDRLPEAMRQQIAGLTAQHSLMHSRAMLGFTDFTPEEHAALPPSVHPLVSINPRTGRKSVYVASHASHIPGMPVAEGRLLIAALIEAATRPDLVYRHAWRVGDLVVWDNRCTLHRGMAFDESCPRDLRRVTTSDVVTSPR
jgi:alpha-ketoglutarate-dependent 2,4-dichlorophenoxyacetate dioxygenase